MTKVQHPITERIDFKDHRARAAVWGEAAIRSMRDAIANPHYTTQWDLDLDHVVRATKMAAHHALKVLGRDKE